MDPKIDTLTGVIIGYALIGNFNAVEQNAIGNWFMLVGQILETNAAFLQLNESRKNDEPIISDDNDNIDIDRLEKMIKIMSDELDKIKRQY